MVSIIQQISGQASKTFENRKDPLFKQNLEKLKSLAGQVSASDVNLNMDFLKNGKSHDMKRPPVMYYIDIVSNSRIFSMGIFILPEGVKIPLHDHPRMVGILKVLHGTINVCSYTCVAGNEGDKDLIVIRDSLVEVNTSSYPCCLTEQERNLHEIASVNGAAAFLDILSPPYECEGRECHYYREASTLPPSETASKQPQIHLVKVRPPADYLFGHWEYTGPPVKVLK